VKNKYRSEMRRMYLILSNIKWGLIDWILNVVKLRFMLSTYNKKKIKMQLKIKLINLG
jgi:hypothetical protein